MTTELERAGRKLRSARLAVDAAFEDARIAGLAALAGGASESEVARVLGVDRMTVRKWRGKREPAPYLSDPYLVHDQTR